MAPVIRSRQGDASFLLSPSPQALAQLLVMRKETLRTQLGMSVLGSVFIEAAQQAARTLAIAEGIHEAGAVVGPLTPAQEAWFAERVEAYLEELLTIAHTAGVEIRDILQG